MKFNIGHRELKFSLRTKELIYEDKVFTPIIRTYGDMKKMYLKDDRINDNLPLYFIFKDVFFSKADKKLLDKEKVRYDVTVILPKNFQDECSKTYGHFNSINKNGKKYQEIYEVLYGKSIFLQQNEKEVFYTNAKVGKKVVIEESFGYITINPQENELLIVANLVDINMESIYDEYDALNGGNYYYLNSGWVKNPNYVKNLLIEKKNNKFKGCNLYDDFIVDSEKFNFLH